LSERCEAGSQENRKGKMEFTGSLEIDLALGWRRGVNGWGRQLYAVPVTVVLYRHAEKERPE
jgi:hypothetical protein